MNTGHTQKRSQESLRSDSLFASNETATCERNKPDAVNPIPQRQKKWIIYEDCRKVMKRFADNRFSLVLTDPPYFIDGMDDKWNHQHLWARVKKGVVGSLPAGMKFDAKQGQKLQEFLQPVAREWLRLLKPGGFALCFSQSRLVHRTAYALEAAGFEIRDILAWKYEGQAKAFTQDHFIRKRKDLNEKEKTQIINRLGGRKTPQLKPQMELIVMAQSPKEGTYIDNWMKYQTGLIDIKDPLLEPNRFPGTVINVPKTRERYGHIAAKPVILLRHLIRIFSAIEEDGKKVVVFDPFAGSGSTGVAARLESRSFIGCEIDEAMGKVANKRIAETL